jgi:hypothetical protein
VSLVVLVCGGRDYTDRVTVYRVLDAIHSSLAGPIDQIVNGGASGADHVATNWAERRGVCRWTYKANWSKWGPSAGPIRNEKMLRDSKPDLGVVFPGGAGTSDMCRRLGEARVGYVLVDALGAAALRGPAVALLVHTSFLQATSKVGS